MPARPGGGVGAAQEGLGPLSLMARILVASLLVAAGLLWGVN